MKSHETGINNKSNIYFYTASSQAKRTFYYPLCVGHFYYEAGYHLTRDSYDSFLIMYILNGNCIVKADDNTHEMKTGQILLLDCYKPHEYYSMKGWEAVWIHFDGVTASDYYNIITKGNSSSVFTLQDSYRFQKYLKKIYEEFHHNNMIKESIISNYITNILTELTLTHNPNYYKTKHTKIDRSETNHTEINRTEINRAEINRTEAIEEVIRYINEHIDEVLSLNELSSLVSLSPYYFTRVFKKEVGMPPHEYIIETRINAAKFYLKTTNLTIKEIAMNLGFSNESSFCTTFKKRENLTPSQYRVSSSVSI
jgi:AraC-like DNA-binding protein